MGVFPKHGHEGLPLGEPSGHFLEFGRGRVGDIKGEIHFCIAVWEKLIVLRLTFAGEDRGGMKPESLREKPSMRLRLPGAFFFFKGSRVSGRVIVPGFAGGLGFFPRGDL